jgi:hypothetical protein
MAIWHFATRGMVVVRQFIALTAQSQSLSRHTKLVGSFDNDGEYMRAAIAEIKETPIDNRKLHNRRGQAKLSFSNIVPSYWEFSEKSKKGLLQRCDDRAVVKNCDLVSWPGASLC